MAAWKRGKAVKQRQQEVAQLEEMIRRSQIRLDQLRDKLIALTSAQQDELPCKGEK